VREEPKDSIDPYTEDERERILEGFREKRPHYYSLVCFQFWTRGTTERGVRSSVAEDRSEAWCCKDRPQPDQGI
jgi:hypothetical protein